MPPQPLIIAHRGDSAACPENTRAAFRAALAAGVDGVELDVRLSRDGVPVVCHDATLARFGGSSRSLRRIDAAVLAVSDVGSWRSPAFAGETVPSLAEALTLCRNVTVCIELKAVGGIGARAYHRRLVEAVRRVVASQRAWRRVLVLCFSGAVLGLVAAADARLRRVRNCERPPRDPAAWLARQPGLHAVCCDRRILTAAMVQACHGNGVRVFAYSANRAPEADRLRRLGVDAILSDRPGWLAVHLRG
jgi:glycerophosphoryl diester phosphodiesterase